MKKLFLTDKPVDDYEIYQSSLFKKALAKAPIMPGSMTDPVRVSAFYAPKIADLIETVLVEIEGLSVHESLKIYATNPMYTTQIRERAQLIINHWSETIPGLHDKVSGEYVVEYIVRQR